MIKYELIPEQLLRENTCSPNNFFEPGIISDEIVLKTHEQEYFERFKNLKLTKKEVREIGFPLSKAIGFSGNLVLPILAGIQIA